MCAVVFVRKVFWCIVMVKKNSCVQSLRKFRNRSETSMFLELLHNGPITQKAKQLQIGKIQWLFCLPISKL